jgi:hypothetical protein
VNRRQGLISGPLVWLLLQAVELIRYPHAPPSDIRAAAAGGNAVPSKRPSAAFDNMGPEDAFWASRIVARFDQRIVRRNR